jgi:hypothetical protein
VRYLAVVIAASVACVASCDSEEKPELPELELRKRRGGRERVEPTVTGTVSESAPPPTLKEMVDRGTHWRFTTANGPVHVWIPEGYNPRRADTIVYVHGWYVNADSAWKNYNLATQFAASAINAMFVVCEAPSGPQDRVYWTKLSALLETVEQNVDVESPHRRVVAVGHSGAWRTLVSWLDDPNLDTIVLVDAVYAEIEKFKQWILADERRRMINIGDGTKKMTDRMHADLAETVVLDGFPSLEEGIPRTAIRARILYIRSNLGHFPLVTNGIALPMILRTLRTRRLMREPLADILERTGE